MSLSPQSVPSSEGTFRQPRVVSQLSTVQGMLSLQLRAVPGTQTELRHVSAPLQALVSGQGTPFAAAVTWQPRIGSQMSIVHTLLSLQTSGVPARQAPRLQTSLLLQMLPSLQVVPSGKTVLVHAPPVQTSLVHALP